jgi:Tol biopolymer transport system component
MPQKEKSPLRETTWFGVYHIDKVGKVSLVDKTLDRPNGIAVSPDGKTIAYTRRKEGGKSDIYLYHRNTRKTTALVVDTVRLFGPVWSPDGKMIAFNRQVNRAAPVQICTINIKTKDLNQITIDGIYKNYNPRWSPAGDAIVFFKEKGDSRDQIYVTDVKGSYQKNITNDTITHNYYPEWVDANTILYTQHDGKLMTIKTDGTGRIEMDGFKANGARYNIPTKQLAYIDEKLYGTLIVFNIKKKSKVVLLTGQELKMYKL